MRTTWMMAAAMLLVAGPALADVKSGVDAWTRGDYKRAVEEWRAPAVAGDADAQFNLGQAYKLGRGVPLDPALARSWFLKAANHGHIQAADNYGLALFENGQKSEAAPWLEKSVARGEPRAQLVLGTMLFNGDGVPRDYPRAYALMTRALQQGLKSAGETLAQMDQYISPADRQQGVALTQRYAAEQKGQRIAEAGGPMVGDGPALSGTMRGRRTPSVYAAHNDAPPPEARHEPSAVRPVPLPASQPAARSPIAHAVPVSHPVAAGGGWRVQLGAFRDEGNARGLWGKLAGRLPGVKPIYASAGGVTRLQAGPFAGKAEAQRACAVVKQSCVVVAP